MAANRKYPVGVQSFEKLRKEGYLYIDKTPFIYKMITEGCPYFLCRPRRFGKSFLVSTLAAVFEGRRELFEAFTTEQGIEQQPLYIATTDWKWEKYPVIRFDFSSGDLSTIEELDTLIGETLKGYEQEYGITPDVADANVRMVNLLRTMHKQTGWRAVVLVDEYDNFILHALGDDEKVTKADNRDCSALSKAYKMFRRTDDLPAFIEAIKTFFASVPYQWAQDNQNDYHYHALLYTLLVAFGADVRAEEPTAKGRADITLKMPRSIYVMELKYDKPVQEALDQIDQKGYAEKYRLEGRPVTKIGIAFSSEERNIADWQAVSLA